MGIFGQKGVALREEWIKLRTKKSVARFVLPQDDADYDGLRTKDDVRNRRHEREITETFIEFGDKCLRKETTWKN